MRRFIERPERRTLNSTIARRARVNPADLADGTEGIMLSIDGRISCWTAEEALRLADRIVDLVEQSHD
ncbi:hypothetical protein [Brevibacterium yomogidense]|uniref:hypothetical protein n=1 Tax=Brevibacterium yomogidense TaxID=946573 RepID=UPI0018E06182|nr:hypothetical protein [Brevibacterium yomogidense]